MSTLLVASFATVVVASGPRSNSQAWEIDLLQILIAAFLCFLPFGLPLFWRSAWIDPRASQGSFFKDMDDEAVLAGEDAPYYDRSTQETWKTCSDRTK